MVKKNLCFYGKYITEISVKVAKFLRESHAVEFFLLRFNKVLICNLLWDGDCTN